jgi:hypothetical protein
LEAERRGKALGEEQLTPGAAVGAVVQTKWVLLGQRPVEALAAAANLPLLLASQSYALVGVVVEHLILLGYQAERAGQAAAGQAALRMALAQML